MESIWNDNLILARSKMWSNTMAKFCESEDFKQIQFEEIASEYGENSDDETTNQTVVNNDNGNNGQALIRVESFVGETSSDDFEDCANKTIAMTREHQNRWEKFGMIKVLDTFDLDQINKVVVPWVEKNKVDKSQHSTSMDEHIVHIVEHHHHRKIHLESDDSLHSLDTANYIRSSRKKKRSSFTTTTIKKFSYVKGTRKHLQKKYDLGNFELNEKSLNEKCPGIMENIAFHGLKSIKDLEEKKSSNNFTPPSRPKASELEPKSLPLRRRRSRQMKRKSDITKRSLSSSSSSSTESPIHVQKPRLKRISRSKNEAKNNITAGPESQLVQKKQQELLKNRVPSHEPALPTTQIDLTLKTSDSDSDFKINFKIPPRKPKSPPKTIQACSSSCNETGFLGASMLSSTALSNTNQASHSNPPKKCLITPIKNQMGKPKNLYQGRTRLKTKTIETVAETEEIDKTPTPEDKSKILLYCPKNVEIHQKHIRDKSFYLTQEHFIEKVGKQNSRRFIRLNSKKFPFEFDCSSTIYFKVPEESEASASSDEDILYIFGREGKLIIEKMGEE